MALQYRMPFLPNHADMVSEHLAVARQDGPVTFFDASGPWVYPGFPTIFRGLSGFFVGDLRKRPCGSSWKTRSVFHGAVGALCASTAPSASTGPVHVRQNGSRGGNGELDSAASSDCSRPVNDKCSHPVLGLATPSQMATVLGRHRSRVHEYRKRYQDGEPPICTDRALELSWKDSNIRYLDHLGNSDIASDLHLRCARRRFAAVRSGDAHEPGAGLGHAESDGHGPGPTSKSGTRVSQAVSRRWREGAGRQASWTARPDQVQRQCAHPCADLPQRGHILS